jgi:hypothetical protein
MGGTMPIHFARPAVHFHHFPSRRPPFVNGDVRHVSHLVRERPRFARWMASQLSGGTPLQYLGLETPSGASVRGQEPIEQLIHYAMDVKAERIYLSIGINSASNVCSVDFYLR